MMRRNALPDLTGFTLLAVLLGVFVLPYAVVYKHSAVGVAYVTGYNSTVAVLVVAILSMLTVISQRTQPGVQFVPVRESGLSRTYLAVAIALAFCWQTFLSVIVLRHSARSIEDTYFLPQLEKAFVHHMQLYTQIEFAYGPLLFYPTVWLAHLLRHFAYPIEISYYTTLVVEHLGGLCLLFYIVNRLPLSLQVRRLCFVVIGLHALNPLMGLNYTLFRFLAPIAALVWVTSATRSETWKVIGVFVATAGLLYISPELGIAFGVAVCAFAATRFDVLRSRAVWLPTAALVAGLIGLAFGQKSQFLPLKHFSGGFNALPLVPTPELFLVLVTVIWIAPRAISATLKASAATIRSEQRGLLISLYVYGIALLPALLSVGEILHFSANGIAFFLLAGVWMSSADRSSRSAWSAALAALYVVVLVRFNYVAEPYFRPTLTCFSHTNSIARHLGRLSQLMGRGNHPVVAESCPAYLDDVRIKTVIGASTFSTPLWQPAYTSAHLSYSSAWLPGFFSSHIDLWGSDAQQITIANIRRTDWLVAPTIMGDGRIEPVYGFVRPEIIFVLPRVNQIATQDLIVKEIQSNWRPVASLDGFSSIYHRER